MPAATTKTSSSESSLCLFLLRDAVVHHLPAIPMVHAVVPDSFLNGATRIDVAPSFLFLIDAVCLHLVGVPLRRTIAPRVIAWGCDGEPRHTDYKQGDRYCGAFSAARHTLLLSSAAV